jgi:hypothetical protein
MKLEFFLIDVFAKIDSPAFKNLLPKEILGEAKLMALERGL